MHEDSGKRAEKSLRLLARGIKDADRDAIAKAIDLIDVTDPILENFKDYVLSRKDEKTLNKVEKQMLTIIFFGRFDSDASKFFKASYTNKADDIIREIKDSYLDQFVIGRKELNTISNKASAIIAVSKHFGFDIQSSKYLSQYSSEVIEETSAKSIRKTTFDRDSFRLSLAIAFDKDSLNKKWYTFR